MNRFTINRLIICLFLLLVSGSYIMAQQGVKRAVAVTTILKPPYSLYLSDYASTETGKCSVVMTFKDLSEPSWNIYLSLKIESVYLKLETSPYFKPAAPISITPGAPLTLTGDELADYFKTDNLVFSGITKSGYEKTGHLPEGLYTFSFEAKDYTTGKVISSISSFTANIQLADPPIILKPSKGEVIKPLTPQFETFQWQLQNADPVTTKYILHLYEVIDTAVGPLTAIANNQVREIFESDPANYMTFMYDASAPQLEDGKIYTYYIQAINADGKEICRNNGKSEVSWFSYGYPKNGKISLTYPENDHNFTLREDRIFQWDAPNNMLAGQQYKYELKMVEVPDSGDFSAIIDTAKAWYDYTTSTLNRSSSFNFNFATQGQIFNSMTKYAWQIKAYTEDKEIAKSTVSTFVGPPCMEAFKAGNHTILVTKLSKGCDYNHLSGEGKVQISNSKIFHKVFFNDIKLERSSGELFLSQGVCSAPCEIKTFDLSPENSENGKAYFMADSLILDKQSLWIKGKVKWDFPHPVISLEKPIVESNVVSLNYDNFTLLGKAFIKENTAFEILDPYNFKMDLAKSSYFFVRDSNKYFINFGGNVTLPNTIVGNNTNPISVAFENKDQLYYLEGNTKQENFFKPIDNTSVTIEPSEYTIDLSDKKTPGVLSDNKAWKGVYYSKYDVRFPVLFDTNGQIAYVTEKVVNVTTVNGTTDICTATNEGLNFIYTSALPTTDKSIFNTFPSTFTAIDINISKNNVNASTLKGIIKIPVISETTDFSYTVPITNSGFKSGYLDQSLDNFQYTYNESGGDQKLLITIKRAVFADKERLDMTLDIEWPKINAVLSNVSGFKVWGDYSIGFGSPNGAVSLDNRVTGKMDDFVLFIDGIGAAKQAGTYAFGTTVTLNMSEDVAGANGPPVANLYSITNNKLLGDIQQQYAATQSLTKKQASDNKNNNNGSSTELDDTAQKQRQLMQDQQLLSSKMLQGKFEMFDFAASKIQNLKDSVNQDEANKPLINTSKLSSTQASSKNGKALSAQEYQEIYKRSYTLVSKLTTSLTTEINSITDPIVEKVNEERNNVKTTLNNNIDELFASLTDQIVESLGNVSSTIPLDEAVQTVSDQIKESTKTAIISRLDTFIDTQILSEFDISSKINGILATQLASVSSDIITQGFTVINASFIKDQINQIKDSVSDGYSPNALKNKLAAKKNALLNTLNPITLIEDIYKDVKNNLASMAKEILTVKAKELVTDLVNEVADKALEKIAENIPLNFDNLGIKLGSGGKIKLDPVKIAMNTSIISLNGEIDYTPDDPKFGNVWKGDITVSVNSPIKFSLPVVYITGKKASLNYWFCQVNGAKDLADKTPQPLDDEVTLGPVKLVAASGRMYHNMKDTGSDIVPDESIDYGASLGMVFFDEANDGKTVRLSLAASYVVEKNGDYVIDFAGDCQLVSQTYSISAGDPDAMGICVVKLNYNSAAHHFLGYGSVTINKPGVLCAYASVTVDMMPGKWSLAIGSRDDRVIFVPGCVGWSPTGWLFVNQNMAELGLGIMYSVNASVGFDIGVVALNVRVDAGVALGIVASVQYNPKFLLLSAGLWAELWAKVIVDYKINLFLTTIKGSVTLVDLYAKATLIITFNPPPSGIEGSASGYMKLCGIVSCDFDASFKTTL